MQKNIAQIKVHKRRPIDCRYLIIILLHPETGQIMDFSTDNNLIQVSTDHWSKEIKRL